MINLDFHTAGLLFVTLLYLIVAGHIIVLYLICCFSHSLEMSNDKFKYPTNDKNSDPGVKLNNC